MISEPTYLAAKMVSHKVASHFEKQVSNHPEMDLYIPEIPVIEALIDTAFWASLRREEGYEPKISMAFVPPVMVGRSLVFNQKLRLTPYNLVKLSPAVV